MIPLVTFPDAQLATLDVLRSLAPGTEAAAMTFGTKTPDEFGDDFPGLPYAAVRLDASAPGYPVVETATIRVAVWGLSEAKGLRLAQVLRALLVSYSGGLKVRSIGARTGPYPTTDPDSGAPLSAFTVAARLRPIPL